MPRSRNAQQADLFDPGSSDLAPAPERAAISADFIARIRAELEATLAVVRHAEALPWPDLTKTYVAELRFESIATWLPPTEAQALTDAFNVEMERLYRVAGEIRPDRAPV